MKYLRYISLIILAAAMWACSHDEPSSPVPTDACYDFVTLESKGAKESVFTLQRHADSPTITYTSAYTFPGDTILKDGQRLIILYQRQDGEPYTTGKINLYGYRRMDNKEQKIVTIDTVLTSDRVKVLSMTRTGAYINMQLSLSCYKTATPAMLQLVLDKETINDPIPSLQLIYKSSSPGLNYFSGYASFDVSALWGRDYVEGIAISYVGPEGEETQTFKKQ